MKIRTAVLAVVGCLLASCGFALATCDPGGCSGGAVAINGSTNLVDANVAKSASGLTSIGDYTKQTNQVGGIATGNAMGSGMYTQQAETNLLKNSSNPFGGSGASLNKGSEQVLNLNVGGPLGFASGNQSQANSGSVVTGAGLKFTFSKVNGQVGQNMSLGAVGNGSVVGSQQTGREAVWGAVSQTGSSYTQNSGQMTLIANQAGAVSGPCPAYQAGTNNVSGAVNAATGFVTVPGFTAANSSLGGNLSAKACGNIPTNNASGMIVANTGTYVKNGPTTAFQYQQVYLSAAAGK
jgi:hypothetical protein